MSAFHVASLTFLLIFAGQNSADQGAAKTQTALRVSQDGRGRPAAPDLAMDALRYESRGDWARRQALLSAALELDSDCASAHWHSGHVKFNGQWLAPEEVAGQVVSDEKLAHYREARRRCSDASTAHFALAKWCRARGLLAERRAHLLVAAQLDPKAPRPQRALGRSLIEGRWMSESEFAQAKERAEQALRSYNRWKPELVALRRQLQKRGSEQKYRAEQQLLELRDPLAIPAVEEVFSLQREETARLAVRLLANLVHREATFSLVRHAVFSQWESVRHEAFEELRQRDGSHYVPLLIDYLRPARSGEVWSRLGDGRPVQIWHMQDFSTTFVNLTVNGAAQDGPDSRLRRTFIRRDTGNEERIKNASDALAALSGQELGKDQEAWRRWWAELNDSYYESIYEQEPERPTIVRSEDASVPKVPTTSATPQVSARPIPPPHTSSCFPAGTLVWTREGPVPIDHVQLGDLVLSVNPNTGELGYRTVIVRTVLPKVKVINLQIRGEVLGATRGHPIWVSGKGWVKVKDLEAGDALRGCGEVHPLDSMTEGEESLAYNLVVEEFHTYFVGESKVLVHDIAPITDSLLKVPGLKLTSGETPAE